MSTAPRECDLVMKGGITSGVVYPSAIRRLSEDYRFRNIGGASAGAIAAVVTAACEYRRRAGAADAFAGLGEIVDEVRAPRFIERLFQPTPAARPAFEVALAFVTSKRGTARRLISLVTATLQRSPSFVGLAAGGVAVWLAFLAFTSWALAADGFSWVDVVAVVLLAVVAVFGLVALVGTAVALGLASFAVGVNTALKENRLGMCSGLEQPGFDQPALTEWLHEKIQECAGLEPGQPLTFAMLAGSEPEPTIALKLVTTDLSSGRPVDLPLSDDPAGTAPESKGRTISGETIYCFDPDEFATLFPPAVVAAMVADSEAVTLAAAPQKRLRRLPGAKLPVVVAARLSLSFPMLLSTVPLWSEHPRLPYLVEHCMSDGGICSNFPIHFFDRLFPGRPTFGLDLEPYPDPKQEAALATEPYVLFDDRPRLPGFSSVDGVVTFFRQLLNAARNWRDNTQSELPGYRDRICQIRLTKEQGGLNLNMPGDVVETLIERGREAGEAICAAPPRGFDWNRHRFTRFLTLMQALQLNLEPSAPNFARFVAELPAVSPEWRYAAGHAPPWWDEASVLASTFFAGVDWGRGDVFDFDLDAPVPRPALRITSRM